MMAFHYLMEAVFTVTVLMGIPALVVLAGDCIRNAHRDVNPPSEG